MSNPLAERKDARRAGRGQALAQGAPFDLVVVGDGEPPMVRLTRAVVSGKLPLLRVTRMVESYQRCAC